MKETMRAVVLDEPGPAENLNVKDVPIPVPEPGWVRIRVKAFGINRSELFTRLGFSGDDVTYPRILGIEATGVVDYDPDQIFEEGQKVVTMMGGMGRLYDGGYAQYTCVPAGQVIPFESELGWDTLGSVPEMLQTAYGSLSTGLDARPGQTLLVRGGTSSVGMTAAVLAKRIGMKVISTTRNAEKGKALKALGVDHVIIDEGEVAEKVREIEPEGVDAAIELIGSPTLQDTLRSTRVHGTVCFTGMLSNEWTIKDFYPIDFLPQGVRLTSYSGDSNDLPASVLQSFLDDVEAGTSVVPIARTFGLDEIREAHTLMESNEAHGKIVVLTC